MNAEVTSRSSEINNVSVPTGIKTLNRRIIGGSILRVGAVRLIILGFSKDSEGDGTSVTKASVTKTTYLDYHATTPVDPRVLEAMLPFFGAKFGNAASGTHSFGWEADAAAEVARKRVADLAGASAREIVFTSGATESNNLALKGIVAAAGAGRAHIVTVATEHKAVLDTAGTLERAGCRVTILRPRPDGLGELHQFWEAHWHETELG